MLPREKMKKFGVNSLNNHDLLAVILGHGTKKEDIFTLSRRLLKDYGANPLLSIDDPVALEKHFNIGSAQSCKLISAIELGRRLFERKLNEVTRISCPQDVFNYMKPLGEFNKEYIYGMYLNTRNLLIHEEVLSIGTLEASLVNIRDIFYPALLNSAYGFILVHNHPSSDESPSEEDIQFTAEVKKAAEILQITFLDHIILTEKAFFSFSELNLL